MTPRTDSVKRAAAAILVGALSVTGVAVFRPSRVAAQRAQIGIYHFAPTTLIPGQGYRLVFANTKGDPESLCRVRAGFVDASGQVINEDRFALRFAQSMTLNLRTPAFESPTMLVRAFLRDEPAGCLSPMSEVTLEATGTSCWVALFTDVEMR
jgi:hypothetical protein